MSAKELTRALGGKRVGAGYMAPCPAHDDREPSLSLADARGGNVLFRCHAGCTQQQVIDALRAQGLWGGQGHCSGELAEQIPSRARPTGRPRNDLQLFETAMRVWQAALPIRGTLVEAYLRSRGLTTTPDR